jgi:hypothetical protein
MSKPARRRSLTPAHLRPITVDIPAIWGPEQALAVLDLLDDLRQAIWTRYGGQIQPLLQNFQEHVTDQRGDDPGDDPSF